MKGFLVFLTVALVASTVNASAITKDTKGPIEDALAVIKCLKESAGEVQASINEIAGTVQQLNSIVASSVEKLNACKAIGGSNPSITDQIAAAQCIMDLGNSLKAEMVELVAKVNADIAHLIATAKGLTACF